MWELNLILKICIKQVEKDKGKLGEKNKMYNDLDIIIFIFMGQ